LYTWDEQALYIAYQVWDDVYVQEHTSNKEGDSIQLGFNLDYGRKPMEKSGKSGNSLADAGRAQRITEINLALTPDGPKAHRTRTFDADRRPIGLISSDQVTFMVVKQPDGLTYEVAIPWSTLGAPMMAQEQSVIGVYTTISDVDNIEQVDPSVLGLFVPNHSRYGKQFGTLLLTEESAAQR
jgi:hypothetical protein